VGDTSDASGNANDLTMHTSGNAIHTHTRDASGDTAHTVHTNGNAIHTYTRDASGDTAHTMGASDLHTSGADTARSSVSSRSKQIQETGA
jgi:hypothetical protein